MSSENLSAYEYFSLYLSLSSTCKVNASEYELREAFVDSGHTASGILLKLNDTW